MSRSLKVESVSAGAIRSRGKTHNWRPEKPRTQRLFRDGDLVSVHAWHDHMELKSSNAIVCGAEWGGNHRDFNRDIWIYFVKDAYEQGLGWAKVPESELGRIT